MLVQATDLTGEIGYCKAQSRPKKSFLTQMQGPDLMQDRFYIKLYAAGRKASHTTQILNIMQIAANQQI